MDTDDKSRLRHDRPLASTEERMVVALEMIADHLHKISRGFDHVDDLHGGHPAFEEMTASERSATTCRDHEIPSAMPDSSGTTRVERTPVKHFAVGGYNYTNLAHAIAEAKRDRLDGGHP